MNKLLFLFMILTIVILLVGVLLKIKKNELFSSCNCSSTIENLPLIKTDLPYSYNQNQYGYNNVLITKINDLKCPSNTATLMTGKNCKNYYLQNSVPFINTTNIGGNIIYTLLLNGLDLEYCSDNKCYQKQLIKDDNKISSLTFTLTQSQKTVSFVVNLLGEQTPSNVFNLQQQSETAYINFSASISKHLDTTVANGIIFENTVYFDYKQLFDSIGNYQYNALLKKTAPYIINVTFNPIKKV